MRARLLIPVALLATLVSVVAAAGRAWADDLGGQNASAGASASGGVVTVAAGVSRWTPPDGSSWAKRAGSDPPAGGRAPNQPYGCTYQLAPPQTEQLLGPGGAMPGQWVFATCSGPGPVDPLPPFWVTNPAPTPASVDPAVVGQAAVSKLALAAPTIEMAPPPGAVQLVTVATWLWIQPGAWRGLTATATAGTVTATATAAPAKVVWEMGDGQTVTCAGPGAPYSPSEPNATTGCSHAWSRPGSYQVTATVYWSVSWTAVGAVGGGNLGLRAGPPARVAVRVSESQAINTAAGGSS